MLKAKGGQMAVCCQNLPLGELSSRSAPSVMVGELFKKFSHFFEHRFITRLKPVTVPFHPQQMVKDIQRL
jgi:predicted TPR repeat methyltransferase